MRRWSDEVSCRKAAKLLDCHERTVRLWCWAVLGGEPTRLYAVEVRKDATGHIWIKKSAIARLLAEVSHGAA